MSNPFAPPHDDPTRRPPVATVHDPLLSVLRLVAAQSMFGVVPAIAVAVAMHDGLVGFALGALPGAAWFARWHPRPWRAAAVTMALGLGTGLFVLFDTPATVAAWFAGAWVGGTALGVALGSLRRH
jgi:hypothetical protein